MRECISFGQMLFKRESYETERVVP